MQRPEGLAKSSKNIFLSRLLDRLSFLRINLIFSVLKNERGVRGEFHFSKLLIVSLVPQVAMVSFLALLDRILC